MINDDERRAAIAAFKPTVRVTVETLRHSGGTRRAAIAELIAGARDIAADTAEMLARDAIARRRTRLLSAAEVAAWSARNTIECPALRLLHTDDDGTVHNVTDEVMHIMRRHVNMLVMMDGRLSDIEKAEALHGFNYAATTAAAALAAIPAGAAE
jgi:plasmid maintenance system antidote protein VapI